MIKKDKYNKMSKLLYGYLKKRSYVMSHFNKPMVLFLFTLFGYGVNTFAYTYTIFNMTHEHITVQLHLYSYKRGKLVKQSQLINRYGTHKFSFLEPDLCLTGINTSPIKKVNRKLFDKAKNALEQFNKAEKKRKEGGYKNVWNPESIELKKTIAELKSHTRNAGGLITLGFCEDRKFMIIKTKLNQLYALTPASRPI